EVDSQGIWTNFSVKWVDQIGTCNVTASYSSEIFNVTGTFTVLPPTVDYIRILDEHDNNLTSIILDIGDWQLCFVKGFNRTVGSLGNVIVSWHLSAGIASLNPQQNYYTNLTATTNGSATLTATYNSISNFTQITVNPRISVPTGLAVTVVEGGNALRISWNTNPEANLAGYNIYRSLALRGEYIRINDALLTAVYYVDSGLTNGVRYYYYVVAVDTSQRLSDPSVKVSGIPDIDTDGDGLLNYEDDDDDDDGILDETEIFMGTSPINSDTDGDGIPDGEDYYPLDTEKWEEPVKDSLSLIWLLIPIFAIVVLILVVALLKRRKKKEEVPFSPPVVERELPPPPPGYIPKGEAASYEEEVPPPPEDEDELPPPDDELTPFEDEEELPAPDDEDFPPPDDEEEPPPPDD
ncbi:MAG: hypothetical protein JSV56_08940, partial [Methanomassiliicoccales archaeon]